MEPLIKQRTSNFCNPFTIHCVSSRLCMVLEMRCITLEDAILDNGYLWLWATKLKKERNNWKLNHFQKLKASKGTDIISDDKHELGLQRPVMCGSGRRLGDTQSLIRLLCIVISFNWTIDVSVRGPPICQFASLKMWSLNVKSNPNPLWFRHMFIQQKPSRIKTLHQSQLIRANVKTALFLCGATLATEQEPISAPGLVMLKVV